MTGTVALVPTDTVASFLPIMVSPLAAMLVELKSSTMAFNSDSEVMELRDGPLMTT